MLKRLDLDKPGDPPEMPNRAGTTVDGMLAEVRRALVEHRPLEPVISDICRKFGFEHFVYATATAPLPDRDSRAFVWTTMPWEWVVEYDREAYMEVDPRITETIGRRLPFVWDSVDYYGKSARVDAFLLAAARHGIRSGVLVPLADPIYVRIGVGFSSSISPIDCERRARIDESLGDLMLFAAGFHDLFVENYMSADARPKGRAMPLSPREVQCLQMAARGMTSLDIAFKLDIAERTVNFHFANSIGKLGVLNRNEAIAVAVAKGLVRISA